MSETQLNKECNFTKIYLVENCYGDPNKVYIGKTKNSREINHVKTYGNQIEYNEIDEINSLKHKDWEPLETYWIQQFIAWGFEVINKRKKGGSGIEFHTQETKDKIGNKNRGRIKTEETRKKLSKPRREGSGENISKATKGISKNKGTIKSQEWRDLMFKIHKNSKHSEETKIKMRKPKPKGFGERLSSVTKGISRPKTKEVIQKLGKSIIQYDLQGNFIKEWSSVETASKILNITKYAITNCLKNKSANTKDFIWKYK